MLIGEYTHTIDDKNRLSLPSKFRSEMGKKVVVAPGLEGALFVFSTKQWAQIVSNLSGPSFLQANSRNFNRYFLGGAAEAEVDAIGRMLLPDFLRERLGEGNRVVVVGVESRVEIWNEQAWSAFKQGVEKQAGTLAEKLGQIGVL